MAKTESNMIALGTAAPDFKLLDETTNQYVTLRNSQQSKATVIMFICNHCPYVKHINHELPTLANKYAPLGVRFIAINSNDVEHYPDDSPENMKITARMYNYPFPYLYDESQAIAKAYQAACTPDFFIFNESYNLVYRGQLDDSRPGNNIPVTGSSIRHALDCILNNKPIDVIQKPSLGCNIKWKY